jgi:sucrose phosphorylase
MIATPGAPTAGAADGHALARLTRFLRARGNGLFSYVHILPFFPYSSDDGFSVIDYRAVDRRIGNWDDVADLGRDCKLAFDLVLNHGSSRSEWFKAFLADTEPYRHWFLTRPAGYDGSTVVRPRTHPLLTPYRKADGSTVHVWTTFSADQVDYDFSRPDVLLEFMRILLEFVERGARMVRLDAIAYLWKEDGTPCLHHPKTHATVKLMRAVIDALALDVILLTETNVPHRENVSYYGDWDEAHMVYNFALPPLVLHAAVSGDAGPLRRWAASLPPPGEGPVFLNFLASHDGIGLTPARGLVEPAAFDATVEEACRRGGRISYKETPDGCFPYELNCVYLDAVAPPSLGGAALRARAFLSAQAAMFALAGVPAVYFHSWVGSENWNEGPNLLGHNRAVNREKPSLDVLEARLSDPRSVGARVMRGMNALAAFRRAREAFAPQVPQTVLPAEGAVFALERGPDERGRRILCIHNLGGDRVAYPRGGGTTIVLDAWESRWIEFDAAGDIASQCTTGE